MIQKKIEKNQVEYLIKNDAFVNLEKLILENSYLPGRMANLKMISSIADVFEETYSISELWYERLEDWLHLNVDGNSPETELALTALDSLGGIYEKVPHNKKVLIEENLLQSLNDQRWRIREVVTESYKRIGNASYTSLIRLFKPLLTEDATPLEIRGILATVAHPELLISKEQLIFSQEVMENAFNYYFNFDAFKFTKEDKAILKKGLSFAPSVIISKNPQIGFSFFEKLLENNDTKDIKTIVKENLKKKRLENSYPDEVNKLLLLTK